MYPATVLDPLLLPAVTTAPSRTFVCSTCSPMVTARDVVERAKLVIENTPPLSQDQWWRVSLLSEWTSSNRAWNWGSTQFHMSPTSLDVPGHVPALPRRAQQSRLRASQLLASLPSCLSVAGSCRHLCHRGFRVARLRFRATDIDTAIAKLMAKSETVDEMCV